MIPGWYERSGLRNATDGESFGDIAFLLASPLRKGRGVILAHRFRAFDHVHAAAGPLDDIEAKGKKGMGNWKGGCTNGQTVPHFGCVPVA